MFAERIRRFFGRFGVRLVVYHSLFLIFSFVVVFGAVFIVMASTLKEKDHELIMAKEKEFALVYDQEGVGGVQRFVANQGPEDDVWVFVRLETRDGATAYQRVPQDSRYFDLSRLTGPGAKQQESHRWIYLHNPGDAFVLEIYSAKMKDGTTLQVGRNSDDREASLGLLRNVFLGLSLPILLLGFLGGIFAASRALHPIRNLIQALRQLEQGEMSARVSEPDSDDELGELARVFNKMADQIQQLVKGMRGVINDIAHDLRTPMTRFRAIAGKALESGRDVELHHEALVECMESSDRILTILDTVMEIAEAKSGSLHLERDRVNLRGLLDEVVELYAAVAEETEIRVRCEVDPKHEIFADSRYAIRAFANLLDNAIKYNRQGGNVWISSDLRGAEIEITVRDDGIGIASEDLPKIWERLYRVDKSRSKRGLGLGLTMVKAIAEAHGGRVAVESTPERGSTFRIIVPAQSNE